MSWLGRLKSQDAPPGTATKPTEPGFVGFVAPSQGHIQKFEGAASIAANDTPADADRWCWPHSDAMTGAELDTFTARVALFHDRGLRLVNAEALADRLVIRDRDGDDRRLCLECTHLSGAGPGQRCGAWRQAGIGGHAVAVDLVRQPQRCPGFCPAIKTQVRT